MPSLVRIFGVALLLTASSVLASPTTTYASNPAGIEARSDGVGAFNPLSAALHPLKTTRESNAKRMARGLPPNKPNFRRAERDRSKPRPSPTPPGPVGPKPTGGACGARNGLIHVTSPVNTPADGKGPRPHLDGYLSSHPNEFGEYTYTAERDQALRVTINDCSGSPFDILASNGFRDFPFVGGIKGFSSDSANLSPRSFNYVYIGGVTQTAPHATPQNVPNAFTASTELQEVSESAIWSFQKGSDRVIEAQWVNADAATPPNTLVYVPSINVFVLTGDVRRFEETFENVSQATFTFEAA